MEEYIEPSISKVIIISYEGEREKDSGHMHGKGACKMDNGCSYIGEFQKGLFHGKGKFLWTDGTSYEGDFRSGIPSGRGKYTWPDGSTFEGDIERGLRHGTGIFKCSVSQVYDGEWNSGKRHGNGNLWYTEDKNIFYMGGWRENLRDGHGFMRYENGNYYEGMWSSDMKNGRGVMLWKDTDESYSGEWQDNRPHGIGEYLWIEGTSLLVPPASASSTGVASSLSSMNNMNPSGSNINLNASSGSTVGGKNNLKQHCNIYRGEFRNGQREGKGSYFFSNGSQYTGEWKDNKKEGEGVFIYPDGRIFAGFFRGDRIEENECVPSFQVANVVSSTATKTSSQTARSSAPGLRSSEDVAPQYRLNIEDVLSRFLSLPSSTDSSENDIKNTNDSITKELERLILRYQSYIKQTVKKLSEMSNKRRSREVNEMSTNDVYIQKWPRLEITLFQSRNIYRRFFCLSLFILRKYFRECDLLDGFLINSFDLGVLIEEMFCHHREVARQLQRQYQKCLLKNLESKDSDDGDHDIMDDKSANSMISKDELLPSNLAENKNPQINRRSVADIDTLLNVSIFGSNDASPRSRLACRFLPSCYQMDLINDKPSRYWNGFVNLFDDSRFPILDRQFVEIFVRLIAKRSLLLGSLQLSNLKVSGQKSTLFNDVFKVFSEKMQPYLTDSVSVPQHVSTFYADQVQEILKKEINIIHFKSFFNSINREKEEYCYIKDFLELLSGQFVNSNLVDSRVRGQTILLIRSCHLASSVDVSDIHLISLCQKKMNYDDFVYHLCQFVTSHFWIYGQEDNKISDEEFESAISVTTSSSSCLFSRGITSVELMSHRLNSWLTSLPKPNEQ